MYRGQICNLGVETIEINHFFKPTSSRRSMAENARATGDFPILDALWWGWWCKPDQNWAVLWFIHLYFGQFWGVLTYILSIFVVYLPCKTVQFGRFLCRHLQHRLSIWEWYLKSPAIGGLLVVLLSNKCFFWKSPPLWPHHKKRVEENKNWLNQQTGHVNMKLL